jgi:hypothetical protein
MAMLETESNIGIKSTSLPHDEAIPSEQPGEREAGTWYLVLGDWPIRVMQVPNTKYQLPI